MSEPMEEQNKNESDPLDGYKVSYAQNREDRIIEGFFPDVENGTYVDIGANDPEDDSVTKIFYDKGWTGVNIEPSPGLYKKLKKERIRDTNVNLGASDKKATLRFREYKNHGLSTFSSDVRKEHEKEESEKTKNYNDYDVQVLSTSDILKGNLKATHIHFMKIDVEGYEYSVIKGNDWKTYRPELVCIEANHVVKNWRELLVKARYSLVFDDGLNEYYLREESLFRKKYFDYANVVLLSGVIINPGVAKRILLGQQDRSNLEKYATTIGILEAKNAELNVKYSNILLALNQQKNIKKQLRGLYDSVDEKILRTIDKRGHIRKAKVKKTSIELANVRNDNSSVESLLDIAKTYDVMTFFRYRAIRNPKKIHYRILDKTYRTSRDLIFRSGKFTYRKLKRLKG
jgi:FkbM family methyltransferase